MERSIAIVSATFYPDPSVASVRVTNWCRMLPDLGWKPVVLTRDRGLALTKDAMSAAVHPEVEVRYVGPSRSTASGGASRVSARLASWSRSAAASCIRSLSLDGFLVPDVSAPSWMRANADILTTLEAIRPDVVLTSAPPHSAHLAGRTALQLGIPWIADFRDPYLLDQRYTPRGVGSLATGRHTRFNQWVYQEAKVVLHAIELHYRYSRLHQPLARSRSVFLPHLMPELGDMHKPLVAADRTRVVTIVGQVGAKSALLLAEAVSALHDFDCELRIIGVRPASEAAIRRILGPSVAFLGPLPNDEVRRQLPASDVLVSMLSKERAENVLVSSKLFEYLGAGSPIVHVNPTRPDRHLLAGVPGVQVLVDPSSHSLGIAIGEALKESADQIALRHLNRQRLLEEYGIVRHSERLLAALQLALGEVGSD